VFGWLASKYVLNYRAAKKAVEKEILDELIEKKIRLVEKDLKDRIISLESAVVKQSEQAVAFSDKIHSHLHEAIMRIAGPKL
jgi:hypothetical protein